MSNRDLLLSEDVQERRSVHGSDSETERQEKPGKSLLVMVEHYVEITSELMEIESSDDFRI